MASKKKVESVEPEQPDVQETADTQEAGPPVSQGPPITDCVILVNLTKLMQPCHLRNGKTVPLAPGPDPRDKHKSQPIQRKLLTPSLYKLKKAGLLDILPAAGQGGA